MVDIQGFGNNVLPTIGDIVHVEAEQARISGGWKASLIVPAKEEILWDEEDPEFKYICESGNVMHKMKLDWFKLYLKVLE